jgi:Domain of unknown function (DUF4416)
MIKISKEVLLFQAVTVNNIHLYEEIERLLEKYYGKIESSYGPFRFDEISKYYQEEMGEKLYKKFFIFSKPVSLENFYRFKLESIAIERNYLSDGKRNVNIDPGSLTLYQLSLLTTKAFSHRTYLAEGIYAECTLIAEKNEYRALDWTYPDYMTDEALGFFKDAKRYLKTLL